MNHASKDASLEPERRRRFFSQLDDVMLLNTALCLDLSGSECRLFFLLCALADADNIVKVSGTDLAQKLKMERTNYQTLVKQLEEKGIVAKVPGEGRTVYRMVNPDFLLKCGPSAARKVMERWDRELESERNAVTRSGVKWLAQHLLPGGEAASELASAKKVTHPKRHAKA
jgi:biotin operon repressor